MKRTKYEYKIIELNSTFKDKCNEEEIKNYLNEFGEQGWENYAIIQINNDNKILSFWRRVKIDN